MTSLEDIRIWFLGEDGRAQAQIAEWARHLLLLDGVDLAHPQGDVAALIDHLTLPPDRAMRARCRAAAFILIFERDFAPWLTVKGWDEMAERCRLMAARDAAFAAMQAETEATDPDRRERWLGIGERWRALRSPS